MKSFDTANPSVEMIEIEDEIYSNYKTRDKYENAINILHNFLEFYEKWLWEENNAAVKLAFKTAKLCESLHAELARGDCLVHFDIYLCHWYSSQFPSSRPKRYKIDFFKKSCDILLEKFLRSEHNLPDEIVRRAVQSYMALCSEERCSNFLDEMAAESVMFKTMCDIKRSVSGASDTSKEREADHLFQHLLQLKDQNQVDILKISFHRGLCVTQDTMIHVLRSNFGSNTEADIKTKNLIIESLLENLKENADTHSKFWKNSSKLDLELLAQIANNYPDFLSAMVDFIQISGQAMKISFDDNFQLTWTSSESFLNHDELVAIITTLIQAQGIAGQTIKSFLIANSSQEKDDTSIWSQLVYMLNIHI